MTVTTDAGFFAVLELIPITGRIDIESNSISGVMEGPVFPALGEYWISRRDGTDGYGERFLIDDPGGAFTVDLDGLFTAQVGDVSEIWYTYPDGNQVGSEFRTAEVNVNYAHDWVNVRTNPQADVSIEVEGKATIEGVAGGDGWFRSHDHNGDWNQPGPPDIVEGDVVTVTADGYTAAVNPIGSIVGTVDPTSDLVEGTLNAPFAEPLTIYCEVWVENGPSIEVTGS